MKLEFGNIFCVYGDTENTPKFDQRPDLKKWCAQKRQHITSFNGGQLLDARNRVFVMEMDTYKVDGDTIPIVVSTKIIDINSK